jgi:hypothetical protein
MQMHGKPVDFPGAFPVFILICFKAGQAAVTLPDPHARPGFYQRGADSLTGYYSSLTATLPGKAMLLRSKAY